MAHRSLQVYGAKLRDGVFLVTFFALAVLAASEVAAQLTFLSWAQIGVGLPASMVLGWVLADLASGVIHFIADNWGSRATPILGPLLIEPFRQHHSSPLSILEHGFLERNANNALVTLPLLAWIPWVDLGQTSMLFASVVSLTMSIWVAFTNEVHAFAHAPHAPAWVRWLQTRGILLSPEGHLIHHSIVQSAARGSSFHYCITSGICDKVANSALSARAAFRGSTPGREHRPVPPKCPTPKQGAKAPDLS